MQTPRQSLPRMFVLMPYVPYPVDRGAFQRVYHLFTELAEHFNIDLVCLREKGDVDRTMEVFKPVTNRCTALEFEHPDWPRLFPHRLLNPIPTTVQHWWSEEVLRGLEKFVSGHQYDYVYFIDLVLWPYIERLFPKHPRMIIDRSRVDWLFQTEELAILKVNALQRLLRMENLWKIARMERQVYRTVRSMIVCGTDDRTFLKHKLHEDSRIFVLPNGYKREFFNINNYPRNPSPQPTLLFCGALDYSPNVDGVSWFLKTIWPLVRAKVPGIEWQIIGKSPDQRSVEWGTAEGVKLIGEVPDVRPYYQNAWMQVVPLRIGGGTRLKIVESLAMKCPVVSTTLGAQGLELQHNRDLVLADEPEAFAAEIIRLCADPQLLRKIADRGEATVNELYHWNRLGQALVQHLKQL